MGYFSDIADEVRRNNRIDRQVALPWPEPAPKPSLPAQAAPVPEPVPSPFPDPVRAIPEPASEQPEPVAEQSDPQTDTIPEQSAPELAPMQPAIDLTDHAADEAERRRAHEAAEAKRKAEFDKKQAEKTAKRQAALARLRSMNDAELLTAAADRVAADTERLTRRNMKEAVSGHIQAKCREDAAFAMLVMDPDKSMISCFQYINRKAQEYAEQEMEDQGVGRTGVYGLDVPDGLCYQWAEDYFNDPDAKEDHKDDEEFVPKPYAPSSRKPSKAKPDKKKPEKKPAGKPPEKAAGPAMEQISLM